MRSVHDPSAHRDRAHREGRVVTTGKRLRLEAATRRHPQFHPIDAIGGPLAALRVSAHEIPAPVPGEQAIRLDECRHALVVEPQPLLAADRGGDRLQRGGVDLRVRGVGVVVLGRAVDARAQCIDGRTKMRWQHLLELRERPGARFRDACDPRRRPQPDRDRHGLLVVEQEGWKLAARAEPVSAGRSPRRIDRVAEVAEALDVVADSARRDAQARGELGAGALGARLQQRQKGE